MSNRGVGVEGESKRDAVAEKRIGKNSKALPTCKNYEKGSIEEVKLN